MPWTGEEEKKKEEEKQTTLLREHERQSLEITNHVYTKDDYKMLDTKLKEDAPLHDRNAKGARI